MVRYILASLIFISTLIYLGMSHFTCCSVTKPQSYWIWAGIQPDDSKADAILYIHQGHLHTVDGRTDYEHQGLAPHPLPNDIYLVYRITDTLPDPKLMNAIFIASVKRWERHGVKVLGIQLDFDSPTSKLLVYNNFLDDFRQLLPPSFKLSITGLSDWIVFGDRKTLVDMSNVTDEIVFQLYQGREHFPDIHQYLSKLPKLGIPFKIGLLANQNPTDYIQLVQADDKFQGSILFVQK